MYYSSKKKDKWMDGIAEVLSEAGVELDWEDESEAAKKDFEVTVTEALKDRDTCSEVMDGIGELYVKLVGKKCGSDSQPMRLKIVYDSKGRYVQQPRFDSFVESMEVEEEDTRLKLTKTDEEYKQKSLVTAKPSTPVGRL